MKNKGRKQRKNIGRTKEEQRKEEQRKEKQRKERTNEGRTREESKGRI